MRIHLSSLVSTAALSVGLALTSTPTSALAQEAADPGPVQRWPSAADQASQGRAEPRMAITRDLAQPSPGRQQPAAGVSSIDPQRGDERRLEQRRSPGGGGGGGGRSGGGTVRGGSPGGAGPRVAVPRGPNQPVPSGRRAVVVPRGYYGAYGLPYYSPFYSYSYFGPGAYYYDAWGWNGAGWNGAGWNGAGWGGAGWGGAGWGPGWGWGGGGGFGYDLGRLRLQVKPRDAEVFIDGYYAGQVNDFDGRLQGLSLETGGYSVEIRKAGWETLTFDVRVTPGRTTIYRGELIEQKP